MEVKIAHCADVHIISKGQGDSGLYTQLLRAFRNMTDICKVEGVDLLLIAGDLFDSSSVDNETLNTIQEALKDTKAKVLISPGNHDYRSLDSPYLTSSWPENVYIFTPQQPVFHFDDLRTSVYGMSFEGTYVRSPLLKPLELSGRNYINIVVAHGDYVLSNVSSDYHPIHREDINNLGADYLALGHIHKRSEVERIGSTYFAYSGNLVGRGFDELGEKGFYIGTVSKGRTDLAFRALNAPRYYIDLIDMTEAYSENTAVDLIEDYLRNKYAFFERNYYRILLTGEESEEQYINWDSVKDRLSNRVAHLELVNNIRPSLDLDLMRKESSLRGVFVNKLMESIEKTDDEAELTRLNEALKYGLQAFEGEVKLDVY